MLRSLSGMLSRSRALMPQLRSPLALCRAAHAPPAGAAPYLAARYPARAEVHPPANQTKPEQAVEQIGKRFAVVGVSGSQYKVSVDDLFCVEKLDAPVGSNLALRRVLLVGEAQATVIGSPLIADAAVHVTVEEQGYAKKVISFKKKAKKGWKCVASASIPLHPANRLVPRPQTA